MPPDSTQYPYSPIVFITDTIGDAGYQASGVLVAPDEVLTASHVVYEQDLGTASNIVVTPGYNGIAPFGSASGTDIHYFPVADAGGTISNDDSQNDYALIHLDHPFSDTGTLGLTPDFAGGTVNVTGYPASASGALVSSVQTVHRDPDYTLLDGAPLGPGSSGGPVWASDAAGHSYVVGVVSSESFDRTVGYNALITTDALHTISAWIASDDGVSATQPGVVCDNAADVAGELPQLETAAQAGALVSITLTDPGLPTLPISLDRLFGSGDALRFITESFAVDVSLTGARGNVPDVQLVSWAPARASRTCGSPTGGWSTTRPRRPHRWSGFTRPPWAAFRTSPACMAGWTRSRPARRSRPSRTASSAAASSSSVSVPTRPTARSSTSSTSMSCIVPRMQAATRFGPAPSPAA